MKFENNDVKIHGRNFLVNIALPENLPSGLVNVSRDPRKQSRKPDVYVGVVEEVGGACFLVKPGDKISFKRWEWRQMDVDDERVVTNERELVILDGSVPAPGMIVVKVLENKIVTSLVLPQGDIKQEAMPSIKGEIIAFSPWALGYMKEYVQIGKILFFQKSRDDQWRYPDGKMVLKVSRFYEICAIADKCTVCGDAHLDNHTHLEEANAVQPV